jgi:MoxR-like ATPase
MNIPELPIETPLDLPQLGTWPATRHVFDADMAWAVRAALAAQRPLLLRGEPGTGKSQLARAVAQVFKRLFVAEVVHARSEAQDLKWQFDAVARLGEAQALAGSDGDAGRRLAYENYLTPGPLWWVFDWEQALCQNKRAQHSAPPPPAPPGWQPRHGSVLLIDEIDKADSDLPNGLLEILGNGAFSVPYTHQCVGLSQDQPPPLVVITTNEERELPPAFVRRCLVLHLRLPKEENELQAWLCQRGELHFGERCKDKVRREAAKQLWADRQAAARQGMTPPGQAEYLDLLRATAALCPGDEAGQLKVLGHISGFALQKYTDEQSL